MSELVVIGGGGHAKVVIATLDALGRRPTAVYDDDPTTHGTEILGVPVVGTPAEVADRSDLEGILAVGHNASREERVRGLSLRWISVVHPAAHVHSSVKLGEGTVVFAGVVVQPGAVLGAHVIVNTGATVDHDCQIGDFAHIGPGAHLCGDVRVGPGALVGVGASVRPAARIGEGATVGAGAAVVANVEAGTTVVGIPARVTDR